MEHLMNIDSDIETIDLCNKLICGILDFKRFNKLKIIKCSHNYISEIINLPSTLFTLECSQNYITSLNNLPHSLINLDCSDNEIKSFDNLPISLKKLKYNNLDGLFLRIDDLKKLTCLPISIKLIIVGYNATTINLNDALEYNNEIIHHSFKYRKKIKKIIEENRMCLYLTNDDYT